MKNKYYILYYKNESDKLAVAGFPFNNKAASDALQNAEDIMEEGGLDFLEKYPEGKIVITRGRIVITKERYQQEFKSTKN